MREETRREVGSHTHRWWKWVRLSILALVVLYALYIVTMMPALWYVDKMWYEIDRDAHHAQVRSTLKLFRERRVSVADIPEGWQEGISRIPGYQVYRYDFLACPFLAIHVVYDRDEQLRRLIPTYE